MKAPLQTNRAFGISFAIFLGLICGIEWLLADHINHWTGGLAAVFLLLAMVRPLSLLLLNRIWHQVAMVLGGISNRILLGMIFYAVMTPFGWVRRLFGHDTMGEQSATNPHSASLLTAVKRQTTPETCRDIF